MKTLVLLRLTLGYFKGIRNFTFEPKGQNANIFGDNETGKTSLVDSFFWLFFGKDSQNKVEFGIKTLENGKPMRGMNHEVEGSFLLNGKRMSLRRVYKEVWTRKRGSTTEEFSGHTTDYFIDGVPTPKGEYDDFIASIIDEKTFKLLTNPVFFAEHIKYEERLATLMAISGGVTDEEVIAGTKALQPLSAILDGRSIDNHKKVIAARRKAINGEIKDIPVRISEANRSMPEMPEEGERFYQNHIAEINELIVGKQEEISRIQNGGEVTVKQNLIRVIEGELLQLKNNLQGNTLEVIASKRRGVASVQRTIEDIRFNIESKTSQITRNERNIQQFESEADKLRERFGKRNAEVFQGHGHDENCSACGQSLPAERIADAHKRAEESFNLSKARELETIREQGKGAKRESDQLQEANKVHEADIERLTAQLEQERKNLQASEASLAESEASVTDVESHSDYIAKHSEIAAIRSEITALQDSSAHTINAVRTEIVEYQAHISELERDRAKFALAASIKQRIGELGEQEKALSEEFERLEHELYLIEEFTRTKTEMLESKINSKFKITQFRLFKTQVNGGLEECCDPMYKGVPYSEGLNQAARFNCGLDIINTLSEHYQISVPILCDGMESVTKPLVTIGQQVRLIVSEDDKKLRVETVGESMKEAV